MINLNIKKLLSKPDFRKIKNFKLRNYCRSKIDLKATNGM